MDFFQTLLHDHHGVLLLSGAVMLLLANSRFTRPLLHPLDLLSTWVHELSHGLAAIAVGGRIDRLHIYWNASGLAKTRFPPGKLRAGLIFSAGYLGTALVGGLALGVRGLAGPTALLLLAGALGLSTLLWVRNVAGFVSLGGVAAALVAAALYLPADATRLLWGVLALAIALNAWMGVRSLFGKKAVHVGGETRWTDAAMVSQVWGGPHWLWAGLWALFTLAATGAGLWFG